MQLFCILFKLLLQHVIECEVLVVIASCEREMKGMQQCEERRCCLDG